MPDTSLGQMFFERARRHATTPAFRVRRGGGFVEVSFRQAAARVEAIAAGLLSAPGGLARRTAVGIVGRTSADWILCDLAVLSLDAIVAPVYPTLVAAEVGYILRDADVEIVIVDDKQQLEKVRSLAAGFSFLQDSYGPGALPLRHHVVIDSTGVSPAPDVESLAALEARGRAQLAASTAEREERKRTTLRSAVATYAYTSGTTGPPKGVLQTHDNWLSLLEISGELQLFTPRTRRTGAFLFLPLAHSFGRMVALAAVFHGGPVVLSSTETLAADLLAARPGVFPAAPRVYEKMHARIQAQVSAASPTKQRLFHWAIAIGKETLPYRQKRLPLPMTLRAQHAVADRLVLSKVRARLGLDRAETLLTGSAAIAPAVHELFLALGLMLYEGYGLTETCPVLTANRPGRWKLGTVGPPLRNVSLRIDDDGEILARGPNVASGYWKKPEASRMAFDEDGWFRTGDIGEMDADGFLRITDRKKDVLKTSGGKVVAPQKIEGMLKSKPLILEAVVVGDGRNFCTALLFLDEERWRAWASERGRSPDPRDAELVDALGRSIHEVNRDLASFESIKYFRIADEAPSVENGLLTASFKVKRKEVCRRFAPLIDEMYETDNAKEAA